MLEPKLREIITSVRDHAQSDGIDAHFLLHREKSSLVRIGNSAVSLSTREDLTRLDINVYKGRKVGSYGLTSDIVSKEQVQEALKTARIIAENALDKDYDPIFPVVEKSVNDSKGLDPELEALSPGLKTEFYGTVIRTLKGNYNFSGAWSSGSTELYVVSTANGNEAYRKFTDQQFSVVLKENDKKWELIAERTGKKAGEFDVDGVIEQLQGMLPVYENNPGYSTPIERQRVLFGSHAVSQIALLSLWAGFIGRSYEEKRSYTAGMSPGDPLFSNKITLADDPSNPQVFGLPFDMNGRKRSRYPLVERGKFQGTLYDSATAAKFGKEPTGHDVSVVDIVLEPGDGPEDMKDALELAGDAIYIPFIHYVGVPDPVKGIFTGSSRFNAMRIQGGKFVAPLFSSRITDAIPSVLSNVVSLSRKAVPVNVSSTYGRREPEAYSLPEWILCDKVRISDVAESF
jgi:predicted Zn-dependent protease